MKQLINNYISQLKEITGGTPWLDESFTKKFTQVNDKNAFVRPIPDLHSVAEIVSHLIEWRLSVISVMKGGPKLVTMESNSNWRTNDELKKEGWGYLLQRFFDSQDALINFLSDKDDEYLQRHDSSQEHKLAYFVEGLIHHDIYHLGQMGIVIKFLS